ncbi:putative porin, partial [bacterium]|nr:putative porin [bacterium]
MEKTKYLTKTAGRLCICFRQTNSFPPITVALFLSVTWFVPQLNGQTSIPSDLSFRGDFRLRYENTSNAEPNSSLLEGRNREVVRFRIGMNKRISDQFDFGARLATGSQDDPNTADVTLGSFVDDLEVSLDRLYREFR